MDHSSASKRPRLSIRDTAVAFVAALIMTACAGPTRAEIRRAPTPKNLERLDHKKSWVREEAALALGENEVAEAASPLETIVANKSERDYVRAAAARALGRIRAPSSLGVLSGVAAERGAPPSLALAVIEALCRYKSDDAVQAISPLGQHDDIRVQAVAKREMSAGCVH